MTDMKTVSSKTNHLANYVCEVIKVTRKMSHNGIVGDKFDENVKIRNCFAQAEPPYILHEIKQ